MKLRPLAIVALAVALPIQASSTFDSSVGGVPGSGLGAVGTVPTIQRPGSTSNEPGGGVFYGMTDGTSNIGASETLTRTLGSLGSQLALALNASEPPGTSITLTGLGLDVFNPAGASLFDASPASSANFPTTFTDMGNEGFAFRQGSAEATAFDSALSGLTGSDIAAPRGGLSSPAGDGTGGHETPNLSPATSTTPTTLTTTTIPVPEPRTLLLLGTALVAAAGWNYRRQTRRK